MTATRATVEYLISRMLRLSSWLLLFAAPLRSPATKSQDLNRRFMFDPGELRFRTAGWFFLVLTLLVSNYAHRSRGGASHQSSCDHRLRE